MSPVNKPVIGVGAVVIKDNSVLLVKRKNPPCADVWAIPGGKVKLGETLQQAAEREILEETGLTIKAKDSIYTFELIERDKNDDILFHYVIIDLSADYVAGNIKANDDATDARWVTNEEALMLDINTCTRKLLQEKYHFKF